LIDEITPHPDEPMFEVQGPIALIRLPLARCRAGDETFLVDNLAVAVRQDGIWRTPPDEGVRRPEFARQRGSDYTDVHLKNRSGNAAR
jgi:hypothetical protein